MHLRDCYVVHWWSLCARSTVDWVLWRGWLGFQQAAGRVRLSIAASNLAIQPFVMFQLHVKKASAPQYSMKAPPYQLLHGWGLASNLTYHLILQLFIAVHYSFGWVYRFLVLSSWASNWYYQVQEQTAGKLVHFNLIIELTFAFTLSSLKFHFVIVLWCSTCSWSLVGIWFQFLVFLVGRFCLVVHSGRWGHGFAIEQKRGLSAVGYRLLVFQPVAHLEYEVILLKHLQH